MFLPIAPASGMGPPSDQTSLKRAGRVVIFLSIPVSLYADGPIIETLCHCGSFALVLLVIAVFWRETVWMKLAMFGVLFVSLFVTLIIADSIPKAHQSPTLSVLFGVLPFATTVLAYFVSRGPKPRPGDR
jgi:hypothetical protein